MEIDIYLNQLGRKEQSGLKANKQTAILRKQHTTKKKKEREKKFTTERVKSGLISKGEDILKNFYLDIKIDTGIGIP